MQSPVHLLLVYCWTAYTAELLLNQSIGGIQLPMESVPITTDVVSSNLDQGEVYNIMW
jgi:hypothetical protein